MQCNVQGVSAGPEKSAPLPFRRRHHAMWAWDGYLYIWGGVTTFAESKPARMRELAEVTTLGDMWRIPIAPGGKPRNWEEVHAVGNLPCPRDEFGFVGLAPLAFSTFASFV
jgi:hypothetical protein